MNAVRRALLLKPLATALVALTLAACVVGPIQESISVPPGLNDNAVELAVLLAVVNTRKPTELTPGQAITDSVLSAILGDSYAGQQRADAWFFEGRQPHQVLAGYTHRGMYMRVAITHSADRIDLNVVEARDVGRNKLAVKLMRQLEDRLHRSLGNVAQQMTLPGKDAPMPTKKEGA